MMRGNRALLLQQNDMWTAATLQNSNHPPRQALKAFRKGHRNVFRSPRSMLEKTALHIYLKPHSQATFLVSVWSTRMMSLT